MEQCVLKAISKFISMKSSTQKDTEKYKEIIDLLGVEKVEKMYFIFGSKKISFATLRHFIRDEKIMNALKDGMSPQKIASKNGICKMTVYRHLRNGIKK